MSKVKIGLMLGGGGAKGVYQLGVIKALEEAGLLNHIEVISGTSVGAINALLLMSKKTHEQMLNIWDELDKENVFGTKMNIFKNETRMYSIEPIANKLIEQVNLKEVRNSKYQGYATAVVMYSKTSMVHQMNPFTMEKKVFDLKKEEDPCKAVMAAVSIPVIFGPTEIDGLNYLDAGKIDNYPVDPLIKDGCNLIFAVPLDYKFNPYIYRDKNISIIDFTSNKVFIPNIALTQLELLLFNKKYKEEKYILGYIVGKAMIERLYEEGIIKNTFGFKSFEIKESFNYIKLSKENEHRIKNLRIKTKRELKVVFKNMKKMKKERA